MAYIHGLFGAHAQYTTACRAAPSPGKTAGSTPRTRPHSAAPIKALHHAENIPRGHFLGVIAVVPADQAGIAAHAGHPMHDGLPVSAVQ